MPLEADMAFSVFPSLLICDLILATDGGFVYGDRVGSDLE